MTKDPVSQGLVNAQRVIEGGTVTYTIWPEDSPAKVVISLPTTQDEASVRFLSHVIDYSFSRSMLLEFGQSDLASEDNDG
jgi:hypothetical protein